MIRSTVVLVLTISAVAQVKCDADGPNRNSANVSRRAADDGVRWLMLRDDQGKVYRYRSPNNKDDFKVSYVDGRESVVLLPPGILQRPAANPTNQSSCGNRKREQPPASSPDTKMENRENPSSSTADVKNDIARIYNVAADAVTSEAPTTTTPRRGIVERNFTGSDDDFDRKNISLARQPPGSVAADDRVYADHDRGKSDANSTADTALILSPIRESESERDRSGPTDNKTARVDTGDATVLALAIPTIPAIKCDGQTDDDPDCGEKGARRQDCDDEKPREICDGCGGDDDDDLTLLVENHIKFNIKLVANSRSPSFHKELYDRGGKPAPEKDNIRPSTIDCDPGKK